jgi:hypothetical protein
LEKGDFEPGADMDVDDEDGFAAFFLSPWI